MWLSVFHSRFARGHATVKGEERSRNRQGTETALAAFGR